jgi:hypothetical protein
MSRLFPLLLAACSAGTIVPSADAPVAGDGPNATGDGPIAAGDAPVLTADAPVLTADAPPPIDARPRVDAAPPVDAAPGSDAVVGPLFPLQRAPVGRTLVDASGRPFLLQGDAAWSLIVQLDDADLETYLAAREAKGFNTLLVSIIEHKFAAQAPRDAFGNAPFTTAGDFSTPNPAYFAHVDYVLQRAEAHGFVVLLTFAYLGYNGGDEGWYQELLAQSTATLRGYGQYVGGRYRDQANIIWVAGGDYNPPNKEVVRQIVAGIRDMDTGHLMTAHCGPESAALSYWAGETWIDLDTVYTYGSVPAASASAYGRSNAPFFLIESTYENEHGVAAARVREQSYSALLAGGMGQIYGNSPIWCFGPPDCFNPVGPPTWKGQLDSRGARDMAVLRSLFDSVPWSTFAPAQSLITAGAGSDVDQAVASVSGDGLVGLVYVPSGRTLTLDVSKLSATITASWVDPVSGARSAAGGPWAPSGTRSVTTPGGNAGGDGDWALLLDAR